MKIKKSVLYAYGIGMMMILWFFLGQFADKLLIWLFQIFNLSEIPYIKAYILLISVLLICSSYPLISIVNSGLVNKKVLFRVLVGFILGGIGAVWLATVLGLTRTTLK